VGGSVPQKHMLFGVGIGVCLCFLSFLGLSWGLGKTRICLSFTERLLLFSKENGN